LLEAALASLPVEPTQFVWLRIFLAAVAAIGVAVFAYLTAQIPDTSKKVIFEPTTTVWFSSRGSWRRQGLRSPPS